MNWTCPHCNANLKVVDAQATTGWSISRCHLCAGFALIRKAEVNVIKIEKAPVTVTHDVPATTVLPKPVIRPAQRKPQSTPAASAPVPQAKPQQAARPPAPQPAPQRPDPSALSPLARLPAPLPEPAARTIPKGIYVASVLATLSGIFFYGQIQKTRMEPPQQEHKPITAALAAWKETPPVVRTPPPLPPPPVIVDQIQETATAPEKPAAELPPVQLFVRLIGPKATLRNGPGTKYSVAGNITSAQEYPVVGSLEDWYQLQINTRQAAWIRSDLVQFVSGRVAAPNVQSFHR